MDFRLVNPEHVTWKRGHGTSVVAKTTGGTKIVVQTPKCSCDVTVNSPGVFRVRMTLKQFEPVHREFEDWLRRVENHASGPWKTGKTARSAVYSSTFSVMAFSDTLVFDDAGKLSADILDAKSCSAILELSGAWTTDDAWGARWKIVQLKCWPRAEPEQCSFLDDDTDDTDDG